MSEHEIEESTEEPQSPRRFLRSRDDRIIGGVGGGLGRYFNVDPVFFRIGFVALAFVGGLGILLYLAALLIVPAEDASGGDPSPRSPALVIAGAIVLVLVGAAVLSDGHWWLGGLVFGPLGVLLVGGLVVWWLVWGRRDEDAPSVSVRPTLLRLLVVVMILVGSMALFAVSVWAAAAGGGIALAVLLIAIGTLLVVAAFRGGARWLIVPALAIAAGVGVVAAADVDLDGGYGDRVYAPASLDDVQPRYDLGAGHLEVDLRAVDFEGATRELAVELGFGEAVLLVPRDVCVVADASVGAGYLRVLDWDDGGFNVGWSEGEGAQANASLIVDAHVGMGDLLVVHDRRDARWSYDRPHGRGGWGDWEGIDGNDDPALGRSPACAA